jgi:hypothetical protein
MTDNKTIEKAILHAIALKEKGVTVPTILAVFPDEKKYISAAFEFIGNLRSKREDLTPPEEAFAKALVALSALPPEESVQKNFKTGIDTLKHRISSVPRESLISTFSLPRFSPWMGWALGIVVIITSAFFVLPHISDSDEETVANDQELSFSHELAEEINFMNELDNESAADQNEAFNINEFDTRYDQTI